jgi:hypothetical protein
LEVAEVSEEFNRRAATQQPEVWQEPELPAGWSRGPHRNLPKRTREDIKVIMRDRDPNWFCVYIDDVPADTLGTLVATYKHVQFYQGSSVQRTTIHSMHKSMKE